MPYERTRWAYRGAWLGMVAGVLGVCLAALSPPRSSRAVGWEPVGLSGGGAMFSPAISPAAPRLMMLSCDMSGAYLSSDGGRNWRMIHYSQLHGNTRCRPAFHPTDPNVIFAPAGGSGGLKVSRDRGVHWQPIGNIQGSLQGEIAIDPGHPSLMLAGTREGAWRSTDGGSTWTRCVGPRGPAVGFHFDQTSPAARRVCFAGTAEGVWRSEDGGATWAEKSAGLPSRELRSFAGGSNAERKARMLYCAVPSRAEGGKLVGGVYRSADRGETWEPAMGAGINLDIRPADQWAMGDVAQYYHVLTTDVKPSTVYALNTNTGVLPPHHTAVFRSDDAGRHWRATFYPDPRFQGFNVEHDYETANLRRNDQGFPNGAAINPRNPEQLFQVTGRVHVTHDGGKSWICGSTRAAPGQTPAPGSAWLCNGLVVTTTWHYYVDPFEPQRHYIAYTDLGFALSVDAGKTWAWWKPDNGVPWRNTCYELAFDPETPGRLWGAFSDVHDIPNDNIISGRHRSSGPGGVCLSTDFGATWKPSNTGLPVAPVVSVVLDPKSPKGRRTLYASVFGMGVYRSTDDGRSWVRKSQGLGSAANLRVCRLQLHPDGTLFALVTAMRQGGTYLADGVGLYRSRDGAENWQLINASQPLLWPKDFTVDAKDSRILYVGAADAGGKQEGGLYRTTDGGVTWARLARKGPQHFGAYLHPRRPGWIYMTLCEGAPDAGLWLSRDNGATWSPLAGLPFNNVQRIEFDPADDATIYVTTFGGSVWRGPASG
jgi:photosystem II stability/assembly factor-like uncharacterized protein